ncbi:hypothetical protein ABW21_db0204176 [Orbilia brochopaga]|nr:hypothetical protein ABW21_db0204176 [Drechslerella brochopaga]
MLFSPRYLSILAVVSCAVLDGVMAMPAALEPRTSPAKQATTCAPFRVKPQQKVKMNQLEASGGITIDTYYTTTGKGMSNIDFYDSADDTTHEALHLSFRNPHDKVIINSKWNGVWGQELRPDFTVDDIAFPPAEGTGERRICVQIKYNVKDKAYCLVFYTGNKVLSGGKAIKTYEVKFPKRQQFLDKKINVSYILYNAGPTPMLSSELSITPLSSKKGAAKDEE